MDFKKIWQNMAEIGPSVGILTFFKQALVFSLYKPCVWRVLEVITGSLISVAILACRFSSGLIRCG